MGSEQNIYSRNKMSSIMEVIRTYHLILTNGFVLDLEKTFYIPSFSINLISISRFVPLGFSFNFWNGIFSLYYKSKLVGTSPICDGLFQISL